MEAGSHTKEVALAVPEVLHELDSYSSGEAGDKRWEP